VPPRHARTEQEVAAALPQAPSTPADSAAWAGFPAGSAFLARLRAGEAPRAVWTAPPGRLWADAVADAVAATTEGARGALVVVPDRRDLDLVEAVLAHRLGVPPARLEADLGPAPRYRAFLAALRGQ